MKVKELIKLLSRFDSWQDKEVLIGIDGDTVSDIAKVYPTKESIMISDNETYEIWNAEDV